MSVHNCNILNSDCPIFWEMWHLDIRALGSPPWYPVNCSLTTNMNRWLWWLLISVHWISGKTKMFSLLWEHELTIFVEKVGFGSKSCAETPLTIFYGLCWCKWCRKHISIFLHRKTSLIWHKSSIPTVLWKFIILQRKKPDKDVYVK